MPVDAPPFAAGLASIDASWKLAFDSADGRRVLPAADLVFWGRCAEIGRGPVLVLADGGLIVAEVLTADKEQLTADSDVFGLVKLPLECLAGVAFDLPAALRARDRLADRIASASGESDQVILTNGDEVAGRLEAIQDEVVRVATVVGSVDVEIRRVQALVFNPALVRRPERHGLHAIAGFGEGSRMIVDGLVLDETSLGLETANGLKWTAAAEELTFLQPLGGRVAYVSDLKAAEYRHVPFLDLSWPYRADRNVTGGQLRAGGRLYPKGIGVHSAARLTYLLAETYTRFQAELAIDDSTGGRGSVRFRVFVDGSPKYTSPTVRGGMAPLPVSVELAGARRLDLVVDYADRADEMDRADWLNARLVR